MGLEPDERRAPPEVMEQARRSVARELRGLRGAATSCCPARAPQARPRRGRAAKRRRGRRRPLLHRRGDCASLHGGLRHREQVRLRSSARRPSRPRPVLRDPALHRLDATRALRRSRQDLDWSAPMPAASTVFAPDALAGRVVLVTGGRHEPRARRRRSSAPRPARTSSSPGAASEVLAEAAEAIGERCTWVAGDIREARDATRIVETAHRERTGASTCSSTTPAASTSCPPRAIAAKGWAAVHAPQRRAAPTR